MKKYHTSDTTKNLLGHPQTTLHPQNYGCHYDDVIMCATASQITSLTIVYSIVYSDADQRKHQSSASLVFVWGIHRGLVNSPHKWPVTRKMFPFDDVIMSVLSYSWSIACQHCSNYIFILDLVPVFNGLGKDNCKMRQDKFKIWDLAQLILEIWWQLHQYPSGLMH